MIVQVRFIGPSAAKQSLGHLEQWSILTPDWAPSSGWVLRSIDCRLHGFPFSARCFGWNTADDSITFMPRQAVLASPGGECCRPGSVSRSWRAPAPCRSFARSDRPARSAATRTHARCERVSGSWRGSLALALKTAHGCADRVDESGCCNRWPCALVQQPIELLAVVHGRIGHRIMPDQLVLGVRVHMVLVAEEAAAMLLDPARVAVLLPQLGRLLLPPCRCAPSLQLGVLVTTVPLRRHRHDTGVDDLPAPRHVAPGRKMLVEAVEQLFDQPGLGQLLAEQPQRRGVRNAVLNR